LVTTSITEIALIGSRIDEVRFEMLLANNAPFLNNNDF